MSKFHFQKAYLPSTLPRGEIMSTKERMQPQELIRKLQSFMERIIFSLSLQQKNKLMGVTLGTFNIHGKLECF